MTGCLHFSLKKVFLFFLLLECFHTAFTQPLTEELNVRLQASDQKKLKKVLELYNKSITTETEAKQILSSDKTTQNDKTTRMYYKKLTESAAYYRDANALRYKIYTDNINKFWRHYKGEKQKLDFAKTLENSAQDLYKKATEFRFSAAKTHKFEEQAILIEQAKDLEKKSLGMLQKVLYAYLTWPIEYDSEWLTSADLNLPKPQKTEAKTEPDTKETVKAPANNIVKGDEDVSGNDSSLYALIQVNEDQMDVFNDFIRKAYPADFENYIINFDKLDYADVNSLRNAWYKYLFGRVPGDTAQLLADEANERVVDTVKASKESIVVNNNHGKLSSKQSRHAKEDKEEQNRAKGTTAASVSNQKIIRYTNSIKTSQGLFTYRVQIAACRLALDEQTLHDIYNGSDNITELFEDNWYKYTIGEYTNFFPARKLRDQIQIPGAFVIAYLHGKRIKATPGNKRMSGAQIISGMNPDSISFRVQIAASRKKLSMMFLIYISDSNIPIDVIHEEGWYKYSLLVGKNYKKAKNLAKLTGIPGAFVVAYYEKTKLDLQAAIKYIDKDKKRVP